MSAQSGTLPPDAVRTMFDRIAPVYDLMNRVMTAGLDGRWRRLTARGVVRPGDHVLDACCGTGDLALADERAGGRVVGLDFSERMLERARRSVSMFSRWIVESGVSRGTSTSFRPSFSATLAARWIRLDMAPEATVPSVPIEHGQITYASTRADPLAYGELQSCSW